MTVRLPDDARNTQKPLEAKTLKISRSCGLVKIPKTPDDNDCIQKLYTMFLVNFAQTIFQLPVLKSTGRSRIFKLSVVNLIYLLFVATSKIIESATAGYGIQGRCSKTIGKRQLRLSIVPNYGKRADFRTSLILVSRQPRFRTLSVFPIFFFGATAMTS